jgi:hypothetical protein
MDLCNVFYYLDKKFISLKLSKTFKSVCPTLNIATTTFYRRTIKLKEGRIVDIVFSNTDESLLAVMKVNQLIFLRIN